MGRSGVVAVMLLSFGLVAAACFFSRLRARWGRVKLRGLGRQVYNSLSKGMDNCRWSWPIVLPNGWQMDPTRALVKPDPQSELLSLPISIVCGEICTECTKYCYTLSVLIL